MLIPPKIGVVNTRLNLIKKGGRFWFNGGENHKDWEELLNTPF